MRMTEHLGRQTCRPRLAAYAACVSAAGRVHCLRLTSRTRRQQCSACRGHQPHVRLTVQGVVCCRLLEAAAAVLNMGSCQAAPSCSTLQAASQADEPSTPPGGTSSMRVPACSPPWTALRADALAAAAVRRRYRELSVMVHPDKCIHPSAADVGPRLTLAILGADTRAAVNGGLSYIGCSGSRGLA